MTFRRSAPRISINVLAMTAMLLPVTSQAQAPGNVSDLVGARAAGGESELESRGFTHIKTDEGDDRKWGYWWNGSRKQCLSVATMDGRFNSITETPSSDCNQKSGGSSKGAAVAAGVAAAALIGAIALAHKSHNHDDGKHYDGAGDEADYERGYRDGLYNQTYHNYSRSDPYSHGYEGGVEQRGHDTSYRNGHHSGSGGYRPLVNVNDLVGARGSSADGEMRGRGFANVDALQSGNSSYTIWYNRQTRQCIQMGVADGRVANVTDIHTSPKCR